MPPQRQHTEDPDRDRLITPAEFAQLLGHRDTTTLSHWLANPPADFPAPDAWDELPTRRRPRWRHEAAAAYATATRPDPERRRARGGRGSAPNKGPRPDRDPRAAEVAQWLAQAAAGTRPTVTREEIQSHYDVPDYTARRILQRAHARHDDAHQDET